MSEKDNEKKVTQEQEQNADERTPSADFVEADAETLSSITGGRGGASGHPRLLNVIPADLVELLEGEDDATKAEADAK